MPSQANVLLAIEYLPIEALNPNARNPRAHSRRQIKQIARSIELFGLIVPVLIDRENLVLAGHGRLLAARDCGISTVPTIRIDHLTKAQAAAFNIADNRLTEHAAWDDRLLGEIFVELAAAELDFSLEVTGFTLGEIDLQIEGLASNAEASPDADDELPESLPGSPVSRQGDLWLLGKHRVLCGNAEIRGDYEGLLEGRSADLIFTDPPYNVRIGGNVSGKGKIHHREFAMASGEMRADEFITFLTNVLHNLAENSGNGSIHFVCMDWRHLLELLTAARRAYSECKNICVWVKDNAGMGSLYRSNHEMVCVFKNGRGQHRNNVQLGQFGRNRTNVWRYPGANTFGRGGEEGRLAEMHPTVKPVALIADAIMDCSARGDLVLDPFLGSGSTLIAAERVGRTFCGMEIDPLYVDTAILRWQRHSGDKAILARTQERFDDIAGSPKAVP